MISSVLALMLVTAQTPEAVNRARIDYNRCLADFLSKSVKGDMKADSFRAAAVTACAAKEQAFRTIVIAVDTKAGFKRADADDNATFEIDDMLATADENFRNHRGIDDEPVRQAAADPAPTKSASADVKVTPASAETPD